MIGALLGLGLQLGTSLYSNYKASKSAKKANAITDKELASNEAWYNKNYNSDYLRRSDNQKAITHAKKQAEDYYKSVRGQAAVTNASDEAVALAKKAGTDMVGDVTSNIAANASNWKDNVENKYIANKSSFLSQKQNQLNQQANNISQAGTNAIKAASGLIQADGSGMFNKNSTNSDTTSTSSSNWKPTIDYSNIFSKYKSNA